MCGTLHIHLTLAKRRQPPSPSTHQTMSTTPRPPQRPPPSPPIPKLSDMQPPILHEIRDSSLGGRGTFALANLTPGTLILREQPLYTTLTPAYTTSPQSELDQLEEVRRCFTNLSEDRKQLFSTLAMSRPTFEAWMDFLGQISGVGEEKGDDEDEETKKRREKNEMISIMLARHFTNAFQLSRRDGDNDERGRRDGLFPTASRLNHSCLPNAYWSFNTTDDEGMEGLMEVRATHVIQAGEEILITYVPTLSTKEERRELLWEGYGFECHCVACEGKNCLLGEERRKDIKLTMAKFEKGGFDGRAMDAMKAASLQEEESLVDLAVVSSYHRAAVYNERDDNFTLALEYAGKAARMCSVILGPEDRETKIHYQIEGRIRRKLEKAERQRLEDGDGT
ncbi:SET domain-containing protein [Aulographum hederae CBS 113979]|uniref:SET domain-containing protein n=1 Tax=Aulographum hederae CBS 113979 TaxID=1176131 RepID=A0A6G1GRM6_9PEZI|nr:SET domain-containing protein [Aulographum hederae CBS 113979]